LLRQDIPRGVNRFLKEGSEGSLDGVLLPTMDRALKQKWFGDMSNLINRTKPILVG
jgi:hypothetical protein